MNRRVFCAMSCLLVLVLAALPISAGDESHPVKGLAGPAQGVLPTLARPTLSSVNPFAKPPYPEEEVREPGTRVSRAEMKRLKLLSEKPLPTGGREIHLDATPTPLAPNIGTNFNGMVPTVWIPYDAALAVGPSHILVMTNSQWVVFDRNGNVVRAVTQFPTWWPNGVGSGAFDPKCVYDPVAGRFVIMAVSQSTAPNASKYHISVSQTGDPTGNWNTYDFDARLDGTTNTSNWADFPGLGYDDNAIYITSNQFTFSDIFQYAKIRVLSKAELYAGAAATYTDFVNTQLLNADGTKAFTIQPARTLSSTSSQYFLNTNSNANNKVTLWRMDGAPASPALVRQATFSVGTFAVPPDAVQQGSGTLVATNDDRMYDVAWRNGVIHGAFGESFSALAAIRYFRADTTSNTLLKDITYTQPGVHYYFPAVTDDAAGNMYMFMSRSSSTEFASLYATGMQPADSAIQPSALIKSGTSTNTSGRWGDYNAIANDPADNLNVIGYGGWANVSNKWATWIANTTFAGSTPAPTLVSVSPASGMQGTNVNVTLTGLNTNWVQGTSVIGISGSNVTASNVTVASATSLTATFNIAAGATPGTRNVTVTTGAEVTSSAPFTVNAAALPTLTSITPTKGNAGANVNVTLVGTNFVVGQTTVNGNDPKITAINVLVTSSTQATATLVIASDAQGRGNYNISVTTPGGTSNTRPFGVYAVPLITSITPANGNPGTSPTITVNGTNFFATTPAITGTGITITFLSSNCPACTTQTLRFTISSSAALGPRTFTLSTPAGTSNGVTFTVGSSSLAITTSTPMPASTLGAGYNQTLAATGGPTPYTWSVIAGALPGGLGLNSSTGVISGSSNATGIFSFTARVTDATSATATKVLSITINALPSITTTSLPSSTISVAYNQTLAATGGTAAYAWAISAGALPGGLGLNGGTGVISGTSNATGTFNFTAQVTDAASATATRALSITINAAPSITTSSLPAGTVAVAYSQTLAATGGTGAYTWAISAGALSAGLSLNSSTGAISGSPTASGTSNFTVRVTDSVGATAIQALSIVINPPPAGVPTLTSVTPSKGIAGTNLNVTLVGTNFVIGQTTVNGNDPKITAINVLVTSSTQATATLVIASDAQGRGNYNISVTTPGGTSNTRPFGVYAVPLITSITPANGNPGTSPTITVNGTNFFATTPAITGTGITITFLSSNCPACTTQTLRFTISSSAALGPRTFTLSTPAGTSNGVTFTVN